MFYTLQQLYAPIRDFLETGGGVLWFILFLAIALWHFIIERYWYMYVTHPREVKKIIAEWEAREDKQSWNARAIRQMLISRITLKLEKNLLVMQVLVALCPLLGLLGTVYGMISVFDIMAVTGTSNARAMASGISMATIPTMAGMVVALSGLYFSMRLRYRARFEEERVADLLQFTSTHVTAKG